MWSLWTSLNQSDLIMSNQICANCKRSLGCSCERRMSSNGVSCCSACVNSIEQAIKTPPQGVQINNIQVKQ